MPKSPTLTLYPKSPTLEPTPWRAKISPTLEPTPWRVKISPTLEPTPWQAKISTEHGRLVDRRVAADGAKWCQTNTQINGTFIVIINQTCHPSAEQSAEHTARHENKYASWCVDVALLTWASLR